MMNDDSGANPNDYTLKSRSADEPPIQFLMTNDDGEVLAELLMIRYGLRANDAGIERADGMTDDEFRLRMIQLLNESLWYASDAIRHSAFGYYNEDRLAAGDRWADGRFRSQHLDDHQDYLNAAIDQIAWIRDCFHEDDGAQLIDRVLMLINWNPDQETLDDETGPDGGYMYPAYGFKYGYADHFSPLASLCLMNTEEVGD